MGQTFGKMPETWEEILEEKNRVLHCSSEILARVQDYITEENTFLMEYDDAKVDAKVEIWIQTNQTRVRETFNKFPNASEELKNIVNVGIENVAQQIKHKMKEDYRKAYNNIKKFGEEVNFLYLDQRNIHFKLQNLEEECAGDTQQIRRILARLRLQTFKNSRASEKMIFKNKKLKSLFTKKVFDIDHKNAAECTKRIDKLLDTFAKNAAKELM